MKKENKCILPVLTVIAAIGAILSIFVFTLRNRENITNNNREYLRDHTTQMALLVDNSLMQGVTNIQALSSLLSGILTSPELDIGRVQYLLDDSIFDFVEFADSEGMNHNTTGGVSEASDRADFQFPRHQSDPVGFLFPGILSKRDHRLAARYL